MWLGFVDGQAQAADEAQPDDLFDLSIEELLNVSITAASFFNETPLGVASTVSVISREDWEQRGARRLSDAFSSLPGVISLPNFLGSSSIRIRGYAQSESRGVATLWDGVSITSFNLATADVDRPNIQLGTLNSIEVIRGPGSAMYGSDAFHGVIALNAFESSQDVTRFESRVASTGFYSASHNHSAALSDGWRMNVALAVSGQPNQNEKYTYTDAGTGLPAEGERDFSYQNGTATFKLASDPERKISYKFGFYHDDADQDDFSGQGRQGTAPSRDVNSIDTTLGMTKVEVKYRFAKASSMTLETYYWDQEHSFDIPLSSTRNLAINGRETRDSARVVYRTEDLFAKTQLSAAFGVRHDKINFATRRISDATTTFVDAKLPFSGVSRTINSLLVDGKTTLPNNDWAVHYGFRLDDYSDFGEQFTPRVGVIYNVSQQQVIKFLYGQAFRAPNAIEVGGAPFIAGNENIKPETIDTYELVFINKTHSSNFEVVLFHSKWHDAISSVDTTGDGNDDTFVNLANNKAHGIEAAYQRKWDPWLVDVSASYVMSKSQTNDVEFTAFPKYIINFGMGRSFSSGWSIYQNNRFHLGADDGPERATIQPEKIKNYWRADINATKSMKKHWDFFANIRNLLDRENILPSLVNAEGGFEEPGISVDVGFRYKL